MKQNKEILPINTTVRNSKSINITALNLTMNMINVMLNALSKVTTVGRISESHKIQEEGTKARRENPIQSKGVNA